MIIQALISHNQHSKTKNSGTAMMISHQEEILMEQINSL
jgi:hypothetical protein